MGNNQKYGKSNIAQFTNTICLYRKEYMQMDLKLVNADLAKHGYMMHSWAKQLYAVKYWWMDGDIKDFFGFYTAKIKANKDIILIAYLDDLPVGQIEIYPVLGSQLEDHIQSGPGDFGFHLLMAPYREVISKVGDQTREFSFAVLQCVLEYLFYISKAENVLLELDMGNKNGWTLAKNAGFSLLKEITLPERTSTLFLYKRSDFLCKYPEPPKDNQLNLFADSI